MDLTEDKDLVVVEVVKEVRILKRQLCLIKNNMPLFSRDNIKYMNIAFELLMKEIAEVKERSSNL